MEPATEPEAYVFNPSSPEFLTDPYPDYHRLRALDPVHRSELGFWVLTRYRDVKQVLGDPGFVSRYDDQLAGRGLAAQRDEPIYRLHRLMMMMNDPPDHGRLRSLVNKAFTTRRVEALRSAIQGHVDALLDACLDGSSASGEADLIADFADPLPHTVICDLLGIPEEDRARFIHWGHDTARSIDPVPMNDDELARANRAADDFSDYFRQLAQQRRAAPGNDLFSAMVAAEEDGDRLSEEELVANATLLLLAGHDSTTNLIANSLLALHRHPDQVELLRREPRLMQRAIEEFLRYDSPVQSVLLRLPSADTEVGGRTVRADEPILALLGAANRDPEVFSDPDRLDIRRRQARALSFGGGAHYCIGAQLARIETDIAISTVLRRFPTLELCSLEPPWRPSFIIRGMTTLPARLRPT